MKKLTFTLSLIFVFFLGKSFASDNLFNCSVVIDEFSFTGGSELNAVATGNGPFTYEWSTGQTWQTIGVSTNGTYCVTITDADGCTSSACHNVDDIVDCQVELTNNQNGNCLTISTLIGQSPFTYLWDDGSTGEYYCSSSLGIDSACVVVTDANGCTSSACGVIDNGACVVQVTNTVIGGNPSLSATASGTWPFTYLWETGETTDFISPTNTGTYCVTITDNTGCQNYNCATLQISPICSVELNSSQNGMCLVAYPQGTGPFTYLWSDGTTAASACNNNPFTDSLCVTITDTNGCASTACGTVSGNSNICQVEIDANYTTTSAQLTAVAQGTAPFSYYWDTGESTQSISPTLSGDYCVTVVDATNCAEVSCIQITINSTCSVSVSTIQNGSCLQAQPQGIAPFTYTWDDGSDGMTYCSNTPGIDSVCVTMIDANGCVAFGCGIIDNGTTCTGVLSDSTFAGGNYLLAFSNGTAPFTYNWSTGETTEYIALTTTGNYCVTITDATSCVVQLCEFIEVSTTSCSVEVADTITGGTYSLIAYANGSGPYTYNWSNGQNTYYANPQSSGTYCVTITDANGCEATDCMEAILPNSCSVDVYPIQNGACLQANAQGIAPFTYLWSDGSMGTSYCTNIQGIDSVCVVVTDANGCESTACGVLDNSGTTNCNVNVYPSFSSNGVELISNTTGVAPYTYNWSNGQTTSSISPSSTGTFQVTITDAFGCVSSNSYTLNCTTTSPNNGITVVIEYDTTTTGNTTFTAYAAGGYGNYSYLWSTGETTPIINAPLGQISVTITDGLGCSVTESVYTCAEPQLVLDNDEIHVWINGGTGPYSYSWSTGQTTEILTVLTGGVYCVTVTDANGCIAEGCLTVELFNDIYGSLMLNQNTTSTTPYEAIVYLIEYDEVDETLTAVDSAIFTSTLDSLNSIQFYFQNVPDGDYLVKAALLQGSQGYTEYLPTYYGDVLFWNDATYVSIPQSSLNFLPIEMVQGINPGGPGFIGGLVSEGANLQASGSVETRDEGDPISNVSILLLTENDEPVTHIMTDENGEFEFPTLDWGTYKVYAEMIGKEQGEKELTISPDSPSANVQFIVNESFVTKTDELWNGGTLNVFPNPTKSLMTVEVDLKNKSNIQINVVNLLGKTMITKNENMGVGMNTLSLDLSQLSSGVYFLNLTDGLGMVTRRIVKE